MSVKSMTGYGRTAGIYGKREINVDIKSVNHRYFDFNVKLAKEYAFLEDKIRAEVNRRVSRGKIDVFVYIGSDESEDYDIEINSKLAAGYINAYKQLGKDFKLKNDVTSSMIGKLPDVVTLKRKSIDETEMEDSVLAALADALDSYNRMREVEGAKLFEDVSINLDYILSTVSKIELLVPESVAAYRERLKNKMLEALEGKDYDEQRLITEVAVFADKVDVGEELVRLKSHVSQFKSLLNDDNAPVGKKLDFIVQEMNREINTTGSKCNSIEITRLVVETKSVIEKIREQIQNIE